LLNFHSNDHQSPMNKTIDSKCLSTSEKHGHTDDESIQQMRESLRKLEHTYLQYNKKSNQFVCRSRLLIILLLISFPFFLNEMYCIR
jgi:hypothetical protein